VLTCMAADPNAVEAGQPTIAVFAWNADTRRWSAVDHGLPKKEFYLDARAGDFNGDGKLDVLTMSIESGRVVYLGDGKGGFTPRGRLPGRGKGRVALGDIDGDGLIDVAFSTPGEKAPASEGHLEVYLNSRELWK